MYNHLEDTVKGHTENTPLSYAEEDKRTLYQALLYGHRRAGDQAAALVYFGRRMTWKRFLEEVDAAAAAMISRGVKKGDTVTIYTPNIPQGVIAVYAANRIGAVSNMVHPLSTAEEALYAIDLAESKLVFTVELNEELVSGRKIDVIRCKTGGYFPSNPKGLVLKGGYAFALRKYRPAHDVNSVTSWTDFLKEGKDKLRAGFVLPEDDGKAKDTAVIMYTGGTTGTSKGVMLSNYAINTISIQMLIDVGQGRTDVGDGFLAILPIFHAFGLAVTVHAPLISGMKMVLVPRFDPKGCFKQIKKEHVLFISGVPALFERMYPYFKNYNLSKVKLMVSGGDKVPEALTKKYNDLLIRDGADCRFRAGYGLTEASGTCTLSPVNSENLPGGCIGKPFTGSRIIIVKPGTTEEVAEGEEGELCFFGPTIMNGYLKNEEATNAVLIRHPDGNTWLHTGDVAAFAPDGNIVFHSRIKRMIKVNGYNVYPMMIEEVFQRHPAVKQVCAVSTPYKNDRKIMLFVVINDGYNPNTIEKELIPYAKDKLNRWSLPVRVAVIDEMPMTKFAKVDYRLLEKQEADRAALQNAAEEPAKKD
ncbi:MAG TPA: class I adenylate-forming enzyme family protein [Methanocorpusculum sp.]|nr:acyl--CoA ligase [Candidatus Methanocorpusculum equi]HJJ33303.1 class I adenylate-forming enzyme family protein [Methanocorpusculum sp.]